MFRYICPVIFAPNIPNLSVCGIVMGPFMEWTQSELFWYDFLMETPSYRTHVLRVKNNHLLPQSWFIYGGMSTREIPDVSACGIFTEKPLV